MSQASRVSFLKKSVAASTAVVFLCSTLAAPLAEANFWQERRKAVDQARKAHAPASQNNVYARLTPEAAGLGQALPAISSQKSLSLLNDSTLASRRREIPGAHGRALPQWLLSLPSAYGDLRKVHLASSGSGRPLVVLIQDVHGVASAQLNISHMLTHWQSQLGRQKPLLVALEGASGEFDLDTHRQCPNPKHREFISRYFLDRDFITGAEYFGMTAEPMPVLWGVENLDLYMRNVEAYRAGRQERPALDAWLAAMDRALNAAAAAVLTPELHHLNKQLDAFHRGDLDLLSYIQSLTSRGLSQGRFPEVASLIKALDIEQSLDFKKVEAERMDLVQALSQRLDAAALQDLVRRSLAYRAGQVSYSQYHQDLTATAERHGLRLASFPAFDQYIRYMLLSEKIDRHRLFDEVEALKHTVVEALAAAPAQKDLMAGFDDLRLVRRLAQNELSPEEWKTYQSRRDRVLELPERGQVLGAQVPAGRPAVWLSKTLAPFEDFYAAAELRNQALVSHTLAKAKETGVREAALVAGGFHTPGLEKLLAEKGISYAVVTPKIGKIEKGSKYLDVFAANRTPLEKLLLGEKLYLVRLLASQKAALPGIFANLRANLAAARKAIDSGIHAAHPVSGPIPLGPDTVVTVAEDGHEAAATAAAARHLVESYDGENFHMAIVKRSGPASWGPRLRTLVAQHGGPLLAMALTGAATWAAIMTLSLSAALVVGLTAAAVSAVFIYRFYFGSGGPLAGFLARVFAVAQGFMDKARDGSGFQSRALFGRSFRSVFHAVFPKAFAPSPGGSSNVRPALSPAGERRDAKTRKSEDKRRSKSIPLTAVLAVLSLAASVPAHGLLAEILLWQGFLGGMEVAILFAARMAAGRHPLGFEFSFDRIDSISGGRVAMNDRGHIVAANRELLTGLPEWLQSYYIAARENARLQRLWGGDFLMHLVDPWRLLGLAATAPVWVRRVRISAATNEIVQSLADPSPQDIKTISTGQTVHLTGENRRIRFHMDADPIHIRAGAKRFILRESESGYDQLTLMSPSGQGVRLVRGEMITVGSGHGEGNRLVVRTGLLGWLVPSVRMRRRHFALARHHDGTVTVHDLWTWGGTRLSRSPVAAPPASKMADTDDPAAGEPRPFDARQNVLWGTLIGVLGLMAGHFFGLSPTGPLDVLTFATMYLVAAGLIGFAGGVLGIFLKSRATRDLKLEATAEGEKIPGPDNYFGVPISRLKGPPSWADQKAWKTVLQWETSKARPRGFSVTIQVPSQGRLEEVYDKEVLIHPWLVAQSDHWQFNLLRRLLLPIVLAHADLRIRLVRLSRTQDLLVQLGKPLTILTPTGNLLVMAFISQIITGFSPFAAPDLTARQGLGLASLQTVVLAAASLMGSRLWTPSGREADDISEGLGKKPARPAAKERGRSADELELLPRIESALNEIYENDPALKTARSMARRVSQWGGHEDTQIAALLHGLPREKAQRTLKSFGLKGSTRRHRQILDLVDRLVASSLLPYQPPIGQAMADLADAERGLGPDAVPWLERAVQTYQTAFLQAAGSREGLFLILAKEYEMLSDARPEELQAITADIQMRIRHVMAPLADRIGREDIGQEFWTLSARRLIGEKAYEELLEQMEWTGETSLEDIQTRVRTWLRNLEIPYEDISVRLKEASSVLPKAASARNVEDLLVIRVIFPDERTVQQASGIWNALDGGEKWVTDVQPSDRYRQTRIRNRARKTVFGLMSQTSFARWREDHWRYKLKNDLRLTEIFPIEQQFDDDLLVEMSEDDTTNFNRLLGRVQDVPATLWYFENTGYILPMDARLAREAPEGVREYSVDLQNVARKDHSAIPLKELRERFDQFKKKEKVTARIYQLGEYQVDGSFLPQSFTVELKTPHDPPGLLRLIARAIQPLGSIWSYTDFRSDSGLEVRMSIDPGPNDVSSEVLSSVRAKLGEINVSLQEEARARAQIEDEMSLVVRARDRPGLLADIADALFALSPGIHIGDLFLGSAADKDSWSGVVNYRRALHRRPDNGHETESPAEPLIHFRLGLPGGVSPVQVREVVAAVQDVIELAEPMADLEPLAVTVAGPAVTPNAKLEGVIKELERLYNDIKWLIHPRHIEARLDRVLTNLDLLTQRAEKLLHREKLDGHTKAWYEDRIRDLDGRIGSFAGWLQNPKPLPFWNTVRPKLQREFADKYRYLVALDVNELGYLLNAQLGTSFGGHMPLMDVVLKRLEREIIAQLRQLGVDAEAWTMGGDELFIALPWSMEPIDVETLIHGIVQEVQNLRMAVMTLGPGDLDDRVASIIRDLGGHLSLVGTMTVLSVHVHRGQTAKERLESFVNGVNDAIARRNTHPSTGYPLNPLLAPKVDISYLSIGGPEVRATVSFGLVSRSKEALRRNHLTDPKRRAIFDLARQRANEAVDAAKKIYKATGRMDLHARSITPDEEAEISSGSFDPHLQGRAQEHIDAYRRRLGDIRSLVHARDRDRSADPRVVVLDDINDLVAYLEPWFGNERRRKKTIVAALGFSDYDDEWGRIREYIERAEVDPFDQRVTWGEPKVINAVWDHGVTDDLLLLLRYHAANQAESRFPGYRVVVFSGPPAGPIVFLLPTDEKLQKVVPDTEVQSSLEEYARSVAEAFNRETAIRAFDVMALWRRPRKGELMSLLRKMRLVRIMRESERPARAPPTGLPKDREINVEVKIVVREHEARALQLEMSRAVAARDLSLEIEKQRSAAREAARGSGDSVPRPPPLLVGSFFWLDRLYKALPDRLAWVVPVVLAPALETGFVVLPALFSLKGVAGLGSAAPAVQWVGLLLPVAWIFVAALLMAYRYHRKVFVGKDSAHRKIARRPVKEAIFGQFVFMGVLAIYLPLLLKIVTGLDIGAESISLGQAIWPGFSAAVVYHSAQNIWRRASGRLLLMSAGRSEVDGDDESLFELASRLAALGAFQQALPLYRRAADLASQRTLGMEFEEVRSWVVKVQESYQIAQELAARYPSREVELSALETHTPTHTGPGRLRFTHDYVLSLISEIRDWEPLIVDVGTGHPPVTTQELAEAVNGQARVVGVDRLIPAIMLVIRKDVDGSLLPNHEPIIAFFDDQGRFVYGFSREHALSPRQIMYVFDVKDAIQRQTQRRSGILVDSEGNELIHQPSHSHGKPNLDIREGGFELPLRDEEEADIVRLFNVTLYYEGQEKIILDELSRRVRMNGYIIVGNVSATQNPGYTEFLVFRKTPRGIRPQALGTQVLFPDGKFRTTMHAGSTARELLFRQYLSFWQEMDREAQDVWRDLQAVTTNRRQLMEELIDRMRGRGYVVSLHGDATLVFGLDEANGQPLRSSTAETVNISSVLNDYLNGLTPAIRSKLRVEADPNLHVLHDIDVQFLQSSFKDLIENALDEKPGEPVEIKLTATRGSEVLFRVKNEGAVAWEVLREKARAEAKRGRLFREDDELIIQPPRLAKKGAHWVSEDELAQLPNRELPFIFNLTRGKAPSDFGGRGIALGHVRRGAKAWDGRVEVQSEAEGDSVYTTFSLFLPSANPPSPRINDERGSPRPDGFLDFGMAFGLLAAVGPLLAMIGPGMTWGTALAVTGVVGFFAGKGKWPFWAVGDRPLSALILRDKPAGNRQAFSGRNSVSGRLPAEAVPGVTGALSDFRRTVNQIRADLETTTENPESLRHARHRAAGASIEAAFQTGAALGRKPGAGVAARALAWWMARLAGRAVGGNRRAWAQALAGVARAGHGAGPVPLAPVDFHEADIAAINLVGLQHLEPSKARKYVADMLGRVPKAADGTPQAFLVVDVDVETVAKTVNLTSEVRRTLMSISALRVEDLERGGVATRTAAGGYNINLEALMQGEFDSLDLRQRQLRMLASFAGSTAAFDTDGLPDELRDRLEILVWAMDQVFTLGPADLAGFTENALQVFAAADVGA
jgi:hypothetical protein